MFKEQGFIQLMVILVLVIIILSLLGVSLASLFQNEVLKENFSFIGDFFASLWKSWFGGAVRAVWDFVYEFFTDFLWDMFLNVIGYIKSGLNSVNVN